MTRGFKSNINNLLHICNELLTAILHIVLLISLIDGQNKIKSNVAEISIYIITSSWVLNISCSICKFLVLVIEKIKKIKSVAKVTSMNNIVETNKTEKISETEKKTVFTKFNF